ncbi:MAG: iron-containing alcohol dehydrogenase family protein, partial [Promethearchaeota archaeon]
MIEEKHPIKFQFRSPRIIFGPNRIEELAGICKVFGNKGFIVCGKSFKNNKKIHDGVISRFEDNDLDFDVVVRKGGEPTVSDVDNLAERFRTEYANWIVGIGGGSSLDLAKAAAGLATNENSAAYYQEGHLPAKPGIPFIAVPTTAGTGSEVTNNSVLINAKKGIKKSIRGDKMLAKVAILDPTLTTSMPPNITAWTGLDALTQAIESYVSKASNALSDYFAKRAIELISANLVKAWKNGEDLEVRENMLYGSLLSALSFSNAKLGAVHGFAHPIGVKFDLPHGLVCGVLLPHIMMYNIDGNDPRVVEKYAWIGRTMDVGNKYTGKSNLDDANFAVKSIFQLLRSMKIPITLSEIGIKVTDIPDIVKDTTGSSLANNPRKTNKESLAEILNNA